MNLSRKILIIDDEPRIRSLFHRFLKEAGYHVIQAQDGETGLQLLKKDKSVYLVILDILLPKTSGMDVFDAIKKGFPYIKTIVSSVYTIDDQEFLIWDADSYYYKSDSIQDLIDKVDRLAVS